MPTLPDKTSLKEFAPVPVGTHLARCISLIHIGHIPNTIKGAKSDIRNVIRLTWELPEELLPAKDGETGMPYVISQDYTLSMHEKASLRKLVQTWLGTKMTDEEAENFDVESLIGKACLLNVIHTVSNANGKTYGNVQSVTSLPGKMKCPEQVNASSIYTWDTMTPAEMDLIPPFITAKMKTATEYPEWCAKNGIALHSASPF